MCRLITLALLFALPGLALANADGWIDLELRGGHLYIPSTVAGIPGRTMIDTGAQINALNQHFVKAHDLQLHRTGKMKITGVFRTQERPVYSDVPVNLFGADMEFRDIVEIDLGAPERQLLLGAGFLHLYIFQFDYPNRRMRALSRDAVDLKKLSNVESKRDAGGGSPLVRVNLNGEQKVWLVMDTGSSGGIHLERRFALKHNWLDRFGASDAVSKGANASARTERFNLPEMTIGPFELGSPIVTVPAEGEDMAMFQRRSRTGTHMRKRRGSAQGLLGYDILKHFVVTVDYKRGHVHLGVPE